MLKLVSRCISKEFKPFIIAEVSANHGGSIQRAKDTVLSAKKSGVYAVKNSNLHTRYNDN